MYHIEIKTVICFCNFEFQIEVKQVQLELEVYCRNRRQQLASSENLFLLLEYPKKMGQFEFLHNTY